MSAKTDQFFDSLKEKVNGVERRLDELKASLVSAKNESQAAVQAKLNKAKAALDAKKQELDAARARVKQNVAEIKGTTAAKLEEWKANHEQQKLEHRAAITEAYAADVLFIAAAAADEAEYAILAAAEARKLADEATTK